MKHPKVYLSSISIAELRVKALKRKIQLPSDLVEIIASTGMELDSFNVDAANQISRFEILVQHDPFDRMILAHAASHRNATFYTADDTLASLGLDWVVHVTK
jgi:PIN domain nuclease of toxin-antitoxin system